MTTLQRQFRRWASTWFIRLVNACLWGIACGAFVGGCGCASKAVKGIFG